MKKFVDVTLVVLILACAFAACMLVSDFIVDFFMIVH